MKTLRLPALGMAALLAAAAASAQEIKFSVPSDRAPAAQAAAPAGTFSNLQIAEEAGWVMAKQTGVAELGFNQAEIDAFMKGFAGAIGGGKPPYDFKTIMPQLDSFMQRKQASYLQQLREQNIASSNALFAKVRQDKDVITLPSGLSYKIIATGYGEYPKPNDVVRVNYTGVFTDGTVFDTSVKQGHPVDMALDKMIPGWIEGLQKINKGGRIRLFIPSSLAYGDNGFRGIPPAAALIFDLELVDIKPPGSPTSAPEGAGSN
jgi:FKBP-type peptidyl-prolyl cis-trans isomerase